MPSDQVVISGTPMEFAAADVYLPWFKAMPWPRRLDTVGVEEFWLYDLAPDVTTDDLRHLSRHGLKYYGPGDLAVLHVPDVR